MKIKCREIFTGKGFLYSLILILFAGNIVFSAFFLHYYTALRVPAAVKKGEKNIPVYSGKLSFKDGGKLTLAYTEKTVLFELSTPKGNVSFEAEKDSFHFYNTFFDSLWEFSSSKNGRNSCFLGDVLFIDLNKDGINDIKVSKKGKYVRRGGKFIKCRFIDGNEKTAETLDGKKLFWKENDFVSDCCGEMQIRK